MEIVRGDLTQSSIFNKSEQYMVCIGKFAIYFIGTQALLREEVPGPFFLHLKTLQECKGL